MEDWKHTMISRRQGKPGGLEAHHDVRALMGINLIEGTGMAYTII